jgi:ABC-type phosphate/phosphonate transport system substrate-binding protein
MTQFHASLPMYDFPELRDHTDALWAAIRGRLRSRGIAAPETLDRDLPPLHDHWLDPLLLLSHTCGYPAVTVLDGRIDIVGSWATVVDELGSPGWYRSVIVAREDDQRADDLRGLTRAGLRLCANGPDSLSGWVSLAEFLDAQMGLADELLVNEVPVLITGAHAASLAAVQRGDADLASVDSWSFRQFSRRRPELVDGLRIVGRGPVVAVTPLFAALGGPVETLRSVLADVASDPALVEVHEALGIVGFVPHGIEAHDPVRVLADLHEPTVGLLRRITS